MNSRELQIEIICKTNYSKKDLMSAIMEVMQMWEKYPNNKKSFKVINVRVNNKMVTINLN